MNSLRCNAWTDLDTHQLRHGLRTITQELRMARVAKRFTNGRRQGVGLPAAFRFDTQAVFVRQDLTAGAPRSVIRCRAGMNEVNDANDPPHGRYVHRQLPAPTAPLRTPPRGGGAHHRFVPLAIMSGGKPASALVTVVAGAQTQAQAQTHASRRPATGSAKSPGPGGSPPVATRCAVRSGRTPARSPPRCS